MDFNSHAHVERDSLYFFNSGCDMEFQLTRSRGAWPSVCCHVSIVKRFQLTRSRGAWLELSMQSPSQMTFQLTRSRGAWLPLKPNLVGVYSFQLTRSRGAWLCAILFICTFVNFNSHAHVERDLEYIFQMTYLKISTHTLTWSVTSISSVQTQFMKFQLTRSRGAWREHYSPTYIAGLFQLTRSRGAWPI